MLFIHVLLGLLGFNMIQNDSTCFDVIQFTMPMYIHVLFPGNRKMATIVFRGSSGLQLRRQMLELLGLEDLHSSQPRFALQAPGLSVLRPFPARGTFASFVKTGDVGS